MSNRRNRSCITQQTSCCRAIVKFFFDKGNQFNLWFEFFQRGHELLGSKNATTFWRDHHRLLQFFFLFTKICGCDRRWYNICHIDMIWKTTCTPEMDTSESFTGVTNPQTQQHVSYQQFLGYADQRSKYDPHPWTITFWLNLLLQSSSVLLNCLSEIAVHRQNKE